MVTASNADVDTTVSRLEAAIEESPASVVETVDHQAGAASVDEELRPTVLTIFGNPAAGTPLLQAAQTIGIDLPQRVLVFEDAEGQTFIAYNDPFYLAERHNISGEDDLLQMTADALQDLADAASR